MNALYKKSLFLVLCLVGIVHQASAMTQSQAHLSVPEVRKLVDKWYNMDKNPYFKKLYDQIVAKEKQFNNSHYVFYNGFTTAWRVPQDLYIKLYAKLHPSTASIENFRAFRWMPVDYQNPKEFLKKELIEHGIVNDNVNRLKAFLLSTNLALFGNVGLTGECTFQYFLETKSHTSVEDWAFKGILDLFDKPDANGEEPILYKYVPRLMGLIKYLKGDPLKLANGRVYEQPQSFSQIFVPKDLVDDVAYLSWVQGIPFDARLADWLQSAQRKEHTRPAAFIKSLKKTFVGEQFENPLFKSIVGKIERGEFAISKALDKYKSAPKTVPHINHLQARLLFFSEYFNIGANIKVFDYNRIPQANLKKYEQELDSIVNSIFRDILNKAAKITKTVTGEAPKATAAPSLLKKGLEAIDKSIENFYSNNLDSYEVGNLKQKTIAAIANKNTKIIDQNAAAKINIASYTLEDGLPVIFLAINGKSYETMSSLIKAGVDVNKTYTADGVMVTPLDFTISKNSKNIVQLLIQNGATVNKQSIDLAKSLKYNDIVKVLEKK